MSKEDKEKSEKSKLIIMKIKIKKALKEYAQICD